MKNVEFEHFSGPVSGLKAFFVSSALDIWSSLSPFRPKSRRNNCPKQRIEEKRSGLCVG